ncbi:MAG: translation initiation factor IF-2 subunit beta [Candidatus Ranarchaeia archaeon]
MSKKTTKSSTKKKDTKKKTEVSDTSEYEKLYKRLRTKIPPEVFEHKRFEFPKTSSFIQGNMTFFTNFKEFAQILDRKPEFVLKFFTKELATAGNIEGNRAVFQGKKPGRVIAELADRFIKTYVLCKECGKPDTKLLKERRYMFIRCDACGAQESVKSV